MAFTYQNAVPWGRNFDEYRRMFRLTDEELELSILGCADGPASFNAQMTELGHQVVSCDPLYQFSQAQIQDRIDATYESVIAQTLGNKHLFVWESIPSVEALGRVRLQAMRDFLDDYEQGKLVGRYVPAQLPDLPFAPSSFDLALCSHFLFMYSPIYSLEFHEEAVEAMLRVAREVRIFPLLTYDAELSPHVEPLIEVTRRNGRTVSIETVPYEFQRGGNKMMRIT